MGMYTEEIEIADERGANVAERRAAVRKRDAEIRDTILRLRALSDQAIAWSHEGAGNTTAVVGTRLVGALAKDGEITSWWLDGHEVAMFPRDLDRDLLPLALWIVGKG